MIQKLQGKSLGELATMTSREFTEWWQRVRKSAIIAWNKSGCKGFPPGVGIETISTRIELAERAGYSLPAEAETVLGLPLHTLIRKVVDREGMD